ncbi:hypothetical protein CSZ94_21370 [Janthinobacterium sp. ROICE36]|nr:hypothetical protein CSZ94_21370 [Janthinobacterium sp. ROICE36]
MASGVFAGAMTSTAALQAALEASHGNGDAAVGYAVAYPFGVVGPMLGLSLAGRILKPVLTPPPAPIVVSEITIDAATLAGAALSELADGPLAGVQVIGVRQGHQNRLPDPGLVLGVGDALMVSGTVAGVEAARTAPGHLDPGRLMKDRSAFDGTELVVSDAEIVGVPVSELKLTQDFPLQIASIRRGDAMILPHPFLTLEFGGRVMAIAPANHAADVRKLFGNSITATAEFSYVSLASAAAFVWLIAARIGSRQAPCEVDQQPSPGRPERAATLMRRINRQPLARRRVVLDFQRNQAPGGNEWQHEMVGHAAPTETAEQEVQAPAEVHEAPKFSTCNPEVFTTRIDGV